MIIIYKIIYAAQQKWSKIVFIDVGKATYLMIIVCKLFSENEIESVCSNYIKNRNIIIVSEV